MKHTIILLFLLAAASAFAQRTVTSDSTWISNQGGIFYENRLIIWSNGDEDQTKRSVGDTSKVFSKNVRQIEQEGDRFAEDAKSVSAFPKRIREIIRQADALEAIIGWNPLDSLQRKYASVLTDTLLQIKTDGGDWLDFSLFVNNAGKLRYRVDTLPAKNAVLIGGVLRLYNFLGSTFEVDLFRSGDYDFYSLDSRVVVRAIKTGSKTNRAAAMPIPESIQAVPTKNTKTKQTKIRRQ